MVSFGSFLAPSACPYLLLTDLEKCRGEYKALKKVDVIYDWLKYNAGQFKDKGYEAYRNEFMDVRSAILLLRIMLRRLIVFCSYKVEPKTDSQGSGTSRR